jgi:hypothetical protein
METNMKTLTQLLLIPVALLSTMTLAGTQVLMQEFKAGKATQNTVVISVEGSLMRMDNIGKKKSRQDSQVVYNVSKKEMLIINNKEKTFSRMDEAFFKEVNQKMMEAKKLMDEQLARMPPEQREMMKNMMGKMVGAAMGTQENKDTKFVKTARTGKFGGYNCRISEYLINGKKHRELCVASVSDMKGANEVFTAMKAMSEMFKELFQSMSKALPMLTDANPFHEIDKLDGFPIATTEFERNKAGKSNELVSIGEKLFEKNFFSPPAGYKEKKVDLGR